MLRLLKIFLKVLLLSAVVTVCLQNPLIFSGAVDNIFDRPPDNWNIPPGVRSEFLQTSDGKRLEMWMLEPSSVEAAAASAVGRVSERAKVVLLFHGKTGNVASFFHIQKRFQSLGMRSYSIDYRGYGRSSGWPTEQGLYEDAETLWRHVRETEKVVPQDIILVGTSLGSGPASYLAEKYHAGLLLLIAPFSSIPEVVYDRKVIWVLSPFVWIHFPNSLRLQNMMDTCVIDIHGGLDRTVRPEHSGRLESAYRGNRPFFAILDEGADHNNVLERTWPQVVDRMRTCFHEQQ